MLHLLFPWFISVTYCFELFREPILAKPSLGLRKKYHMIICSWSYRLYLDSHDRATVNSESHEAFTSFRFSLRIPILDDTGCQRSGSWNPCNMRYFGHWKWIQRIIFRRPSQNIPYLIVKSDVQLSLKCIIGFYLCEPSTGRNCIFCHEHHIYCSLFVSI